VTDALDANALTSDERWAVAAELSRNVAVPKIRSRRWWVWAWIVAVAFGLIVLAFPLRFWIVPAGEGGGVDFVPSQLAAQSTLTALLVLVLVYGAAWGILTERFVERWSTIMSPLSRTEKRSVRRQLAGKAPVDQDRLPIILAIARQNQRLTEGAVPLFAAWVLIFTATAIRVNDSSEVYMDYLGIVVFALLVGSAIQLAVRYRTTKSFIEAHENPNPGD